MVDPGAAAESGSVRALYGLIVAAVVLPALLLAVVAWRDYDVVTDEARLSVAKTTDALSEHADKVFETDELILQRVLDRIDGVGWDEIGGSPSIHDFLVGIAARYPQVESVFIVDPSGRTVASSRSFPMPRYSVTGRDYFQAARTGAQGLFVSAPFRGQVAGTIAFTVSVARLGAEGTFDGLVAVTVSPSYFERFYHSIAEAPLAAAASVLRADGAVLIRYAGRPDRPERVPDDHPLLAAIRAGQQRGVLDLAAVYDGRERIVGFRRLAIGPVLVTYGLDRAAVVATWRSHILAFGLLAAASSLLLVLLGLIALRRTWREQAAAGRLAEETARRRQAEEELNRLRKIDALGRLTGGVAHDFNNLLTVIAGNLDLIEAGEVVGDRIRRRLAVMRSAADNGAALVRRLLAFSRRQPLRSDVIDLAARVSAMRDLLERSLRPDIAIATDLPEGLWPVDVDVSQLEFALLNLAVNARDAMPGPGRLTLSACNCVLPDDRERRLTGAFVELAVADTGQGMSEEVKARVFEPFFSTKPASDGTGLGLSQVYGFAQQSGGTAAIDSTPGRGTTVRLYLPRATRVPGAAAVAPPVPETLPGRVLVVDDNPAVAEVVAGLLESIGCRAVVVASAAAARDRLRAGEPFDALLSDVMMPGDLDGLALARMARQERPALTVILATGYSAAAQAATEEGFVLVPKPLSAAILSEALRRADPTAAARLAS